MSCIRPRELYRAQYASYSILRVINGAIWAVYDLGLYRAQYAQCSTLRVIKGAIWAVYDLVIQGSICVIQHITCYKGSNMSCIQSRELHRAQYASYSILRVIKGAIWAVYDLVIQGSICVIQHITCYKGSNMSCIQSRELHRAQYASYSILRAIKGAIWAVYDLESYRDQYASYSILRVIKGAIWAVYDLVIQGSICVIQHITCYKGSNMSCIQSRELHRAQYASYSILRVIKGAIWAVYDLVIQGSICVIQHITCYKGSNMSCIRSRVIQGSICVIQHITCYKGSNMSCIRPRELHRAQYASYSILRVIKGAIWAVYDLVIQGSICVIQHITCYKGSNMSCIQSRELYRAQYASYSILRVIKGAIWAVYNLESYTGLNMRHTAYYVL